MIYMQKILKFMSRPGALITTVSVLIVATGLFIGIDALQNMKSLPAAESINGSASNQYIRPLRIHFIDIDCSADSIFVELPDGRNMLIDGGHAPEALTTANYIKTIDSEAKLDFYIGTHQHGDHTGGVQENSKGNLLESFNGKIGKFYMPEEDKREAVTNGLFSALSKNKSDGTPFYKDINGNRIEPIRTFDRLPYEILNVNNGELKAEILAPKRQGPSAKPYYQDDNDYSLVLILTYRDKKFLLCGDASFDSEAEMLANPNINLKADLLKLGHHGTNTSTSDKFLDAVMPAYAVGTGGVDRSDGNARGPSLSTANKIYERNIKFYRADEQGTVIASFNGTGDISFNSPDGKGGVGEKLSNMTLNDYYYGGQLEENALGDKDYAISNGRYRELFKSTFDTAGKDGDISALDGFTAVEGIFDENKFNGTVLEGGKWEAQDGVLKVYRDAKTPTDPATKRNAYIRIERSFMVEGKALPLMGNLMLEANIRHKSKSADPENYTALLYMSQSNDGSAKNGNFAASARFNKNTMIIDNFGNSGYPGAEAITGLDPEQFYNIKYLINTRTGRVTFFVNDKLVGSPQVNALNVTQTANIYTVGFGVYNDLEELYVDDIALYMEDYLFEDDFSDMDSWTVSGTATNEGSFWKTTGSEAVPSAAAKLSSGSSIEKAVDTSGKYNIAVDFAWRNGSEAEGLLKAEWFDGKVWNQFASISKAAGFKEETIYLPSSAASPDFRLKFTAGAGGGYIDNVYIRAAVKPVLEAEYGVNIYPYDGTPKHAEVKLKDSSGRAPLVEGVDYELQYMRQPALIPFTQTMKDIKGFSSILPKEEGIYSVKAVPLSPAAQKYILPGYTGDIRGTVFKYGIMIISHSIK